MANLVLFLLGDILHCIAAAKEKHTTENGPQRSSYNELASQRQHEQENVVIYRNLFDANITWLTRLHNWWRIQLHPFHWKFSKEWGLQLERNMQTLEDVQCTWQRMVKLLSTTSIKFSSFATVPYRRMLWLLPSRNDKNPDTGIHTNGAPSPVQAARTCQANIKNNGWTSLASQWLNELINWYPRYVGTNRVQCNRDGTSNLHDN